MEQLQGFKDSLSLGYTTTIFHNIIIQHALK